MKKKKVHHFWEHGFAHCHVPTLNCIVISQNPDHCMHIVCISCRLVECSSTCINVITHFISASGVGENCKKLKIFSEIFWTLYRAYTVPLHTTNFISYNKLLGCNDRTMSDWDHVFYFIQGVDTNNQTI